MSVNLNSRRVDIAFQPRALGSHQRWRRGWIFFIGLAVGFAAGVIYANKAMVGG